jgi:myo-inositol-1(or 4)-monophosphatase
MSQPDRCSDLSLRDSGLDQPTLEQLVAVAREAASAGAERLMHHYGHLERIREKGLAGDLVTEADEAAEAAVLAVLQRQTPEFGVLA